MTTNTAIIGAGPTGLIAAIELKRQGVKPTIYEARNCIGGQWAYEVVVDEPADVRTPQRQSISSAMYPRLTANLPKRAMQLSDFKLPDELTLFPSRVDVLDYLDATAKQAGLIPLIRFNRPVQKIIKTHQGWCVSTAAGADFYSHVIIATGKDSHPNIPKIKGLDHFVGSVTHSQSYRLPNLYQGKKVVLVGACVSSEDISLDLSSYAERVYICGTFPPDGHKCYIRDGLYGAKRNISQHARPQRVGSHNVLLQDGKVLSNVDAIILCTGYIYNFPFLGEGLKGLELRGSSFGPLYMNMFYPADPTLIFLGLPRFTVHFANVYLQSRFCAKVLSGELKLPPANEIQQELQSEECVLQKSPSKLDEYHNLVFASMRRLSELTGEPHLDWSGFLRTLNNHKRQYQQDYRQYPFTYDLKE